MEPVFPLPRFGLPLDPAGMLIWRNRRAGSHLAIARSTNLHSIFWDRVSVVTVGPSFDRSYSCVISYVLSHSHLLRCLVSDLLRSGLFLDRQFGFRDAAHYYYPLNQRVQEEWNQGRWPLWEPEENAGMPLLGNPTAAVFYPGNWFSRCCRMLGERIYIVLHWPGVFGMLVLMRVGERPGMGWARRARLCDWCTDILSILQRDLSDRCRLAAAGISRGRWLGSIGGGRALPSTNSTARAPRMRCATCASSTSATGGISNSRRTPCRSSAPWPRASTMMGSPRSTRPCSLACRSKA